MPADKDEMKMNILIRVDLKLWPGAGKGVVGPFAVYYGLTDLVNKAPELFVVRAYPCFPGEQLSAPLLNGGSKLLIMVFTKKMVLGGLNFYQIDTHTGTPCKDGKINPS